MVMDTHPPPQHEVDILGLDGHIYKGRMDTRLPGILGKDSECLAAQLPFRLPAQDPGPCPPCTWNATYFLGPRDLSVSFSASPNPDVQSPKAPGHCWQVAKGCPVSVLQPGCRGPAPLGAGCAPQPSVLSPPPGPHRALSRCLRTDPSLQRPHQAQASPGTRPSCPGPTCSGSRPSVTTANCPLGPRAQRRRLATPQVGSLCVECPSRGPRPAPGAASSLHQSLFLCVAGICLYFPGERKGLGAEGGDRRRKRGTCHCWPRPGSVGQTLLRSALLHRRGDSGRRQPDTLAPT